MKKFTILFTLLIFQTLQAQSLDLIDENKNLIDQAKGYYQEKEYRIVIQTLGNILPQLDKTSKIDAHKYLGFSYVRMNDKISAKEHFKILLKLNPDFTLDPADADSSIIAMLNAVKKEIAQESAICSCFIPGSGQLLKGEEKKGKLLMLGTSLSLVSSTLAWVETYNRQIHYLGLGPDSVEYMDKYYNDYNKFFKISIASTSVFAGIYIYCILDALFANTEIKVLDNRTKSLYFTPEPKSTKIGYKITF